MFSSLLILLAMPILDTSRIRGSQFRPLLRISFWLLAIDFLVLLWIGQMHVAYPFVEIGAIATAIYFAWFLVLLPSIGIIENTLADLAITKKS